jgi:hypothetical protein
LDYLLLQAKVKLGEQQAVVLPKSFEGEQEQLRYILDKKLPIANLAGYQPYYLSYDQQGEVVVEEGELWKF